jgi:hypothetical protein
MAEADDAAAAFAREAGGSIDAVQRDADALAPLLEELAFAEESALLEKFRACLAEYRALDRTILELAVENSNLKAQRLSFGAVRQAADEFRDAVEAVQPRDAADAWHVRALAATALANVREIQALQAPHIAEPDDAPMAEIEKRMTASEAAARKALGELAGLASPASRPDLAAAVAALDRLMGLNAELIVLSRRNSEVRSLALSLNQKRTVTAECDTQLHALQAALEQRGFTGTR